MGECSPVRIAEREELFPQTFVGKETKIMRILRLADYKMACQHTFI